MDEELKGVDAVLYVGGDSGGESDADIYGEVIGVCDVQHATQAAFLPFLALPRSLAGKRIALVVLDDE